MFFFFAGGVTQQVRRVITPNFTRCVNCNSIADLVEYEHVLKLFFVPVWRWPGKEPAVYCGNCRLFFPPSMALPPPPSDGFDRTAGVNCGACGAEVVDRGFRFCPYCGEAL